VRSFASRRKLPGEWSGFVTPDGAENAAPAGAWPGGGRRGRRRAIAIRGATA